MLIRMLLGLCAQNYLSDNHLRIPVGFLDWVSDSHVARELGRVRYTSLVIIELIKANLRHRNQNVQFMNLLRKINA